MLSLPHPAAVAFDLDGTLIDSEPILIEAQRRTLKAFDIDDISPDHPKTFGMGMGPGVSRLCEFYGLEYAAAIRIFEQVWSSLSAAEITLMPGAYALLSRFKAEGVRLALVTSGDPAHVQNSLAALDVPGAFECVIDAEAVPNLKPSPEPYLKAAELLSIAPRDVIAFEDSGLGVSSALAAGMTCVAVHANVHDRPEMAPAHVKIRSLEECPPFR